MERRRAHARATGLVYHLGALLASPVPALVAWLYERRSVATIAASMAAVTVVLEIALAALVFLVASPGLAMQAGNESR